jgi:hypothetical protein
MGSDWKFVAGEHIDCVNQETVKVLAGLNPQNDLQLAKIRKALGINVGVIRVYEEKHGNLFKDRSNLDPIETDDYEFDDTEEEEGDIRIIIIFIKLPSDERIGIFQRLESIHRSLLSPPLITSKRKIYSDLNTIIYHISIRLYILLIIDFYMITRFQNYAGFESSGSK